MSPLRAISLALAAYTLWVLTDTTLKVVGGSRLPAYEVIAFQGLSEAALLMLYAVATRGGVRALWPARPRLQLLRSCLDLFNNFFVVVALRHLPLALFYILIFLAPMATALLAAIFLGERLEWKKGLAILTGFAGVVIAVDPFGTTRPGNWVGYLACLVCVGCFSANMVWSRVMTQTEEPESMTFVSAMLMAVSGFAAMLWHAEPLSAAIGGQLLATGLFCVVGSICFFRALKSTSAANVAQYHYSQLITGALLGYAIWRERLSPAMLAGAALILLAGIYTAAAAYRGRSSPAREDAELAMAGIEERVPVKM